MTKQVNQVCQPDKHGLYEHWKGNLYRVLFTAMNMSEDLKPDEEVTLFVDPDFNRGGGDRHIFCCRTSELDRARWPAPVLRLFAARSSTDDLGPSSSNLVVYVCLYGEGRISVRAEEEFTGLVEATGRPRFVKISDPSPLVDVSEMPATSSTTSFVIPTITAGTNQKKNCHACAYSGIEPDSPYLICGHPDAGVMGLFIKKQPLAHCPDFIKFKQHPGRNPDGILKGGASP